MDEYLEQIDDGEKENFYDMQKLAFPLCKVSRDMGYFQSGFAETLHDTTAGGLAATTLGELVQLADVAENEQFANHFSFFYALSKMAEL